MFMVLLKFSGNKGQAGQFMAGHKDWLERGFADGVFLLAGSLQPGLGGGIVAGRGGRPRRRHIKCLDSARWMRRRSSYRSGIR